MDAQTAAELRRELAPAMRDGSLSADELVNYVFSREAAQGYSADINRRAVQMAENQIQANRTANTDATYGNVAVYSYARGSAQREAIAICQDLLDAGIVGYLDDRFIAEFLVKAANRRPLDRVADRFGF